MEQRERLRLTKLFLRLIKKSISASPENAVGIAEQMAFLYINKATESELINWVDALQRVELEKAKEN